MGMRRTRLLFQLGIVVALASAVAACTKGGQFDPTTLLDNDMFNSKKTLQGQREPVFPGGVPGATSGIPQDLFKGYQPPPDQTVDTGAAATPMTPPAVQAPTAEAKVEPQPKPKPKPKVARAPAPRRTEISVGLAKRPQPAPQQQAKPDQTAWPAPPPAAAAQPSQSVWPAPPSTAAAQPSQSIWPNPPATSSQ